MRVSPFGRPLTCPRTSWHPNLFGKMYLQASRVQLHEETPILYIVPGQSCFTESFLTNFHTAKFPRERNSDSTAGFASDQHLHVKYSCLEIGDDVK